MVVRVVVEIKRGDKVIESSALVNSGYEAEEPELHIPIALARTLGFNLESLRGERYRVVGAEVTTYILGNVLVRVKTEDRSTEWINAKAVTVPGEYEVILSDALTEQLGIEIVKPKKGLWRFSGETKTRESAKVKYWIN
ncbi:MAG TPA: hypothetical protein EYH40_04505 [Desulfurococcales archaeon]|nr:hypothetical protein [Desulfurococcales archaeon]